MNYNIINIDTIKNSMMGNDDMVKQFVGMYLSQCPVDFENLEKAVSSQSHQDIKDAAHHIKPTMEYIGASNLRLAFQEIESMGKEKAKIELIAEKFNVLRLQFNDMLEELKTLQ